MNEIELIFDKLYSYFNVATITELAQKLDMSQPAVTNWIISYIYTILRMTI